MVGYLFGSNYQGHLFSCASCKVGLATLCPNTRRSRVVGYVQENGQRFYKGGSIQRRVFAEKALTPLLQPASSLQFSQLLQALQHISSGGNTNCQEEVSKERL